MSEKQPTKVDDVEALLAQTQCQQCDYKGCRPYAEAMVSGRASILIVVCQVGRLFMRR